jgi:hypothetical protein
MCTKKRLRKSISCFPPVYHLLHLSAKIVSLFLREDPSSDPVWKPFQDAENTSVAETLRVALYGVKIPTAGTLSTVGLLDVDLKSEVFSRCGRRILGRLAHAS